MARTYLFKREIDSVPSPDAEPKREGIWFDLYSAIKEYGHRTAKETRDENHTVVGASFYIPGLLTQNSVILEMPNPDLRVSDAEVHVHATGLVKRVVPKLRKDLETLYFKFAHEY